jgi:hypothetical protein
MRAYFYERLLNSKPLDILELMNLTKISPMLVQYLVGLCCLKWHPSAIDVTIGDMVLDPCAEKERDVDVTVTISEEGKPTHAFKAYEVKRERTPLDVAEVEQLCLKLLDMPSLTHRAIVSASGFTAPAIKKAMRHEVTLYEFCQWTRPLQEQFPLLTIQGTAEECFPMDKFLLSWVQPQCAFVATRAKSAFSFQLNDTVFAKSGKKHKGFATFADVQNELLLRSTEVLHTLEPAATILRTFPVPFSADENTILGSPVWPHTHTIDLSAYDIHVKVDAEMCKFDLVTISGHLQWQRAREKALYYVLTQIPNGEAFAGSLISTELRDGHMTALTFSPKTREIGVNFIRLEEKHHNAIRNLKLDLAPPQSQPNV